MKSFSIECDSSDDLAKISRVRVCVADNDDPEQRKEWITFQLEVDLPTVRNGATLRANVLYKASDILKSLSDDFQLLADQGRS